MCVYYIMSNKYNNIRTYDYNIPSNINSYSLNTTTYDAISPERPSVRPQRRTLNMNRRHSIPRTAPRHSVKTSMSMSNTRHGGSKLRRKSQKRRKYKR